MSEPLQYLPTYLKNNPLNESLDYFFKEHNKKIEAYREKPKNETRLSDIKVLEVGTRKWTDKSTHHKDAIPGWTSYLMTDFMEGEDVDVVCDVHELTKVFKENTFDVVWSSSTFEHLHSPWIAAQEILKVLKPGGLFFIQTHLAFPEHGYPHDYFRFTRQGLERLFEDASEKVSCYDFEATLTPHLKEIDWNTAAPNFLNVCIAGVK